MQQVMVRSKADAHARGLVAALPLYAASLIVTLAGIGAVGVTISSNTWTPIWVVLAVAGHIVSIALRHARVPSEVVFYPVMVLGVGMVAQQVVAGGPLAAGEIGTLPIDMGTAAAVGAIAAVRSFTMVTNASLLFSPVPAITMLALVGSANPNAEVPVFFGLFLLSSLFIVGYEAHLRRIARLGRPVGSALFHLLTAWSVTLLVAAFASLFPLVVQPTLGQFSPFAFVGNRFRNSSGFQPPSNTQAAVGQGPIRLSPTPVYEVYAPEGGRLRTSVFTQYTGRAWVADARPNVVDITSARRVDIQSPSPGTRMLTYRPYEFDIEPDPDREKKIATRTVRQRIVTRGYTSAGVPGLGRIIGLRYPQPMVSLNINGCINGNGHGSPGRSFEVVSEIAEPTPEQLRAAPPVDLNFFGDRDTLELPQSTFEVQALAREITQGIELPYDRVLAILAYIEKNCRYTLEEEITPQGEDAAAHYLFKTRRGACDLASTSVAVMCRAVGVPARVAVGYVAQEPLESGGGFMVRQEHAHMWVEAFFPGIGWTPFDAAPPLASIRENPVLVAWYRALGMFSKIGGGGLDALLVVLVVLVTAALALIALFKRLRLRFAHKAAERRAAQRVPGSATAQVYQKALRRLERLGWRREPWMTSQEYLDFLRQEWASQPQALAALERLTTAFQRAFYAGETAAEVHAAAEAAAQDLSRVVSRRPKPPKAVVPSAVTGAEGAP